MTTKKIQFANKAVAKAGETSEFRPDSWVSTGEHREEEPTVRFTIDIPTDLHTRIKAQCAARRVKMKEAIRALLEQEFPPTAGL